jgi:rhodanese-related sulfurtransferase
MSNVAADDGVISVNPEQAWELYRSEKRALLVDVRSSMEFLFIGHPLDSINIAWIDEPDWAINPNFTEEIRRMAETKTSPGERPEDTMLILICRSGVRSVDAGKVLVAAGFSQVYNVLEGFEGGLDAEHHRGTLGGWRFRRLPWEQC